MPAKSPQPSDAPKVQIETTDLLGNARVQQISLDSNRLRVKTESLSRFANFIAMPSRGTVLDAVLWVLSTAVTVRLPLSLALTGVLPPVVYGVVLALGVSCFAFILAMVFVQIPDMRFDCFWRFCLLSLGFCIASQFLWVL